MKRTLPALVLVMATAGCASVTDGAASSTPMFPVTGYAHAGPVCPVETIPPDPGCADRPVAGAVVWILGESGATVAEIITDPEGEFEVTLPAGTYTVVPRPVEGLMGTPAAFEIIVSAATGPVDLAYDTGIR